VFSVRGLAQALEVRYVGEGDDDLPRYSRREALAMRPARHENVQSNLEQTMEGKRGEELQRILLNSNFPFSLPARTINVHVGIRKPHADDTAI
jgi:hypothetical protein